MGLLCVYLTAVLSHPKKIMSVCVYSGSDLSICQGDNASLLLSVTMQYTKRFPVWGLDKLCYAMGMTGT